MADKSKDSAKQDPADFRASVGTIAHGDQRYPTCGDWFEEKGVLAIKVSRLPDWRYTALVALHELIEAILCRHKGIPESLVTEFDKAFEAARQPGNEAEPGDQKNAPYNRQHVFATIIEKAVAQELGVNWRAYERAILALDAPSEGGNALLDPQGGQQVLPVS